MRNSGLIFAYLQQGAWNLLVGVYGIIQRVVWVFSGTRCQLNENQNENSYHKSAQLLRVVARFKFDEYLSRGTKGDFILVHTGFVNPEYVLQDHITLYDVNDYEATFVEALPGQELWRSRYFSHLLPSQYTYAVRVIILPINHFHKLAASMGPIKEKLIFVTNTTRCGSTLLTQIFEETGRVVSFSEPCCMSILSKAVEDQPDEALKKLIKSSLRLLCKPTSNKEIVAYAIKLAAPAMAKLPFIMSLFPNSVSLFIYRDCLKVAQSLCRVSHELAFIRTAMVLGRGSASRLAMCVSAMGFPSEDYRIVVRHELTIGVLVWAACVRSYLKFLHSGVRIAAIRFEDIVGNPSASIPTILEYCGLSTELTSRAIKALERDSQKGSRISTTYLARHETLSCTGETKEESDKLLIRFGFPPLNVEYIAENTITKQHET